MYSCESRRSSAANTDGCGGSLPRFYQGPCSDLQGLGAADIMPKFYLPQKPLGRLERTGPSSELSSDGFTESPGGDKHHQFWPLYAATTLRQRAHNGHSFHPAQYAPASRVVRAPDPGCPATRVFPGSPRPIHPSPSRCVNGNNSRYTSPCALSYRPKL